MFHHPFRRQAMRLRASSVLLAAALALTACGGGGGGAIVPAPAPSPVGVPAAKGVLSLLAGQLGGGGNLDGPIGRFSANLSGIVASPSGTLYVRDLVPWPALRVINQMPGQEATVTTLPREQFALVGAVDAAGNRYEFDGEHIYKRSPAGVRTLLAGNLNVGDTVFGYISATAIDAAGTLYVADNWDHVIRKVTPQGTVTLLAGSPGQYGQQDGTGEAARFGAELDFLAIDRTGNLYSAGRTTNVIRKITPAGAVTTLSALGPDAPGSVNGVEGIGADASGNVYVLHGNLRRITPDGAVSNFTPPGPPGSLLPFGIGSSLAQHGAGNFYVASTSLKQVLHVTPAGEISAIAGRSLSTDSVDGKGAAARFSSSTAAWPASSLYVDAQGKVFVTEGERVRRIAPGGDVTTLALPVSGSIYWQTAYYTTGYAGGGDLLAYANGVLSRVDANGNSRFLAGQVPQGGAALLDGVGANASFVHPQGFVADGQGNVYCVDQMPQWVFDHDWRGVLRRISVDGTVTTLPVANLPNLNSWFVDRDDKLILATDKGAVLRLEPDNSLTQLRPALAETQSTFSRTNTTLAGDRSGNLYIADTIQTEDREGAVLHKITPAGVDTILAGKPDSMGVQLGSAPGSLGVVSALAVGDDGTVYLMTENAVLKLAQ